MADLSGSAERESTERECRETSCMLVHTLGPELGLGLGRARLGYGLGRAGLGLPNCQNFKGHDLPSTGHRWFLYEKDNDS